MKSEHSVDLLIANYERIIQDIEKLYANTFDEITKLDMLEVKIAKVTQTLLKSREGALEPLRTELKKNLSYLNK